MISEPSPSGSGYGTGRPTHSLPPFQGRPSPILRLDFWTVAHPLRWKLAPYEVTVQPSFTQTTSWDTLLYWQQLLDSAPRWPEPTRRRIPELVDV